MRLARFSNKIIQVRCILCSRSMEKGQKALEEINRIGKSGSVELLQLDVTDEKSIESAAKTVEEKYGRYVLRDRLWCVDTTLTLSDSTL